MGEGTIPDVGCVIGVIGKASGGEIWARLIGEEEKKYARPKENTVKV